MSSLLPPTSSPEQVRQQHVLSIVLFGLSVAALLFGLATAILWALGKAPVAGVLVGFGVLPFCLLAYRLGQRGHTHLAAYISVAMLLVGMVGTSYHFGVGHASLLGYAMVTLLAGILIGNGAALLCALLSVGIYVIVGVMQTASGLPSTSDPATSTIRDTIGLGLTLLALVAFQWLSDRERNRILRREQELRTQLSSTNERLQHELDEHSRAEMRSVRRSEELEALREISLVVTAQLEMGELLNNVVKLGCRLLNISAGSIYLVDERKGDLELITAYGFTADYIGSRLVPGEGLAGKILQSGEPLAIQDYRQWPGRSPKWEEEPLTGVLGVPLKRREQTIGILSFEEFSQARSFDEHDVWLASLFANQVAIAIENARLFESAQRELVERERAEQAAQDARQELEKRNSRLEALYRIGQVVNWKLDTEAILDHLTDEAMRVTRATHGQVLVVQTEKECFVRRSLRGFSPEETERARTIPLPLDRGVNGRVYRTHQTVCVDDIHTEPGYFPLIAATRTELAVPIIRQEQVLGNLDLQSPEVGAFHDVDLDYLNTLADQVAVALTNARLLEEAQREISERKRAQATLRTYAERLERSNRELVEFAYIASHDLQEPLRKVHAFGDRLQARYGQVLGEQGNDYLERMQKAAHRMQALIDSLLAYSRVTTRAQPFVAVDLAQVTREVLSDLEVRIEQVGGRVEMGDMPTIDADPTQMRQLLQNLIGNALKFHRPDEAPVIKVSAKLFDDQQQDMVDEWMGNGMCQIVVHDNGIGFDEKYLDRIFQVFQRLHGRGEYEGTGIGLATCRKIADRHRGSITARSRPGEGSMFIVTLPTVQPAEKERP